jgi:hypothetical protein
MISICRIAKRNMRLLQFREIECNRHMTVARLQMRTGGFAVISIRLAGKCSSVKISPLLAAGI